MLMPEVYSGHLHIICTSQCFIFSKAVKINYIVHLTLTVSTSDWVDLRKQLKFLHMLYYSTVSYIYFLLSINFLKWIIKVITSFSDHFVPQFGLFCHLHLFNVSSFSSLKWMNVRELNIEHCTFWMSGFFFFYCATFAQKTGQWL